MEKKSILIVESDPVIQHYLYRLLQRRFRIFGMVENGESAILSIPKTGKRPDLVLLGNCTDCTYGQFKSIRLLRFLYRVRIVVLCSNYPAIGALEGVSVLRKPFVPGQLFRLLQHNPERSQARYVL